jgi:2-polyprenyl-3-methyl-5-hydroxy-6-metoxy-1,4-benzoquinol methylase
MKFSETENVYPTFYKTAMYLIDNAFFFRRTLPKLFESNYDFEYAERICKTGFTALDSDWNKYYKTVHRLIDFSMEFLKLQVGLKKTGKYQYSTFQEIIDNVYSKTEEGPDYLWPLYFSEIFWKVHYRFVDFFIKKFVNSNTKEGNILEIPLGSGYFLCEFLRKNPNWQGTGIDLSEKCINFSKNILDTNNISKQSYHLIKDNLWTYNPENKFDRIMCGEFLEHLEDPLACLKKLYDLMEDDGKLFLTVAVYAAMIDHIYLYRNSQEVRDHIIEAGFKIEHELVQAVFDNDDNNPEKLNIPASYTAILSKK